MRYFMVAQIWFYYVLTPNLWKLRSSTKTCTKQ